MVKIDAHHHLWKYNLEEFGWINEEMADLKKDFMPSNLLEEMSKIGYEGSVAVQARQELEETKFLLKEAEKKPFIKGVVGWLDICSEKFEDQLKEFSKYQKLKGIRHVVQDEPDDNFMLKDEFIKGISLLEKYNLTYDILIFPKQLDAAIKLVAMFPNQKFVLNHIGKPLIREGIISPWDKKIQELAKYPNIWCKLSGMVTEANWKEWNESQIHRYIKVITEAFGKDKLMIGSDWPVCKLAGDYKKIMECVETYFEGDVGLSKILGQNAIEFYNL